MMKSFNLNNFYMEIGERVLNDVNNGLLPTGECYSVDLNYTCWDLCYSTLFDGVDNLFWGLCYLDVLSV